MHLSNKERGALKASQCNFFKKRRKRDPYNQFCWYVDLRVFFVSGGMRMTKAAVRNTFLKLPLTPTPSPIGGTSQGVGRICLTSMTYPIHLNSWLVGETLTEKRVVFFPTTCSTFYLPARSICVCVCTQSIFVQPMFCLYQWTTPFQLRHSGKRLFFLTLTLFFSSSYGHGG